MEQFQLDPSVGKKVQKLYQKAVATNLARPFFITLFEYVDLLRKNLPESVWNTISEEEKKQVEDYLAIQKTFLKDATFTHQSIEEFLKEHNIQNPSIQQLLTTTKALLTGNAESTLGVVRAIKNEFDLMVKEMKKDSSTYKVLLEQMYVIDHEGNKRESDYEYFKMRYDAEYEKLDRIKRASIWYYWGELSTFHDYYINIGDIHEELELSGKYISLLEIKKIKQELYDILNVDNPEGIVFLRMDVFKENLELFHEKLLELIDPASESLQGTKTETSFLDKDQDLNCGELTLSLGSATLQYRNNAVLDISPDNHDIELLVLLMRNKNKVVTYTQAAQALRLNSFNEKDKENAYYKEAIKDIKRSLTRTLKDTGMKQEEIEQLIQSKKNIGYILKCSN